MRSDMYVPLLVPDFELGMVLGGWGGGVGMGKSKEEEGGSWGFIEDI